MKDHAEIYFYTSSCHLIFLLDISFSYLFNCPEGHAWFVQRYPWNLNLINFVEDNVVFPIWEGFNSIEFHCFFNLKTSSKIENLFYKNFLYIWNLIYHVIHTSYFKLWTLLGQIVKTLTIKSFFIISKDVANRIIRLVSFKMYGLEN